MFVEMAMSTARVKEGLVWIEKGEAKQRVLQSGLGHPLSTLSQRYIRHSGDCTETRRHTSLHQKAHRLTEKHRCTTRTAWRRDH